MANKRLFVDMDGTLARFHDEANFLERMYEENFFYDLKPFETMVAGIELFKEQFPDVPVYIISSCIESPYCVQDKNKWLNEHTSIDLDHRIFPAMGSQKADFIPGGVTKDDYLLDDYNKGLNEFLYAGGSAIKCHNNINQRGLGAYGGSPGNLWLGPMVHTDDLPSLIAAEIAQHMGLEYDLTKAAEQYEDIVITPEGVEHDYDKSFIAKADNGGYIVHEAAGDDHFTEHFTNPLNAIRYLKGNEDFLEYNISSFDGESFSAPGYQLRALCSNMYNNPDFKSFIRADRSQFIEDARAALLESNSAIVGQLRFIYKDMSGQTKTGETITYHSMAKMLEDLDHCRDIGQPVEPVWFIKPPKVPLNELTDFFELDERLYYEHNYDSEKASEVAEALLTPYARRTAQQMDFLVKVWHEDAKLGGSLREFLRLTEKEMADYMKGAKEDNQKSGSKTLDDMISSAGKRASGEKEAGSTPTNNRGGGR